MREARGRTKALDIPSEVRAAILFEYRPQWGEKRRLARRFGVGETSIHRVLAAAGIWTAATVDPAIRAAIRDRWIIESVSKRGLARAYGLSVSTVIRILAETE